MEYESSFSSEEPVSGHYDISPAKLTRDKYYSDSNLIELLDSLISELDDELGFEKSLSISMLIKYEWDIERIISGVRDSSIALPLPGPPKTQPPGCCSICRETLTNLIELNCYDSFCTKCLVKYINDRFSIENHLLVFQCPKADCESFIDFEVLLQYLNEEEIKNYNLRLLQNFIENNRKLIRCKFNNCNKWIFISENDILECACGTRYCRKCSELTHRPFDCVEYTVLCNKIENINIIFQKSCPSCTKTIDNLNFIKYVCNCGYESCIKCLNKYHYGNCKEIFNFGFKVFYVKDLLEDDNHFISRKKYLLELCKLYIDRSNSPNCYKHFNRFLEKASCKDDAIRKRVCDIYRSLGLLYGYIGSINDFNKMTFYICQAKEAQNLIHSFQQNIKSNLMYFDKIKNIMLTKLEMIRNLESIETYFTNISKSIEESSNSY